MNKMRIGDAFSESFGFLKANWMQMLLWFGGALVLLGLLGYLMLGSTMTAMAMAPNDPTVMMGAMGKFILFGIFASIILYGVCMLVWRGGMHPGEAPNFVWAFQAGPAFAFGMLVVMIAAYILLAIVMFVLALIFGGALMGMGSLMSSDSGLGAMSGGMIALVAVLYVAFILFILWVQGRFSVAGPVMAERLTRNPVTGLSESWKLTQASQWTIVGFYVVFAIAIFAYVFVAGMIFGAILGAVAGGSVVGAMLTMVVMGLVVYLPMLMMSFSAPVGIYRAIAPQASTDIFS